MLTDLSAYNQRLSQSICVNFQTHAQTKEHFCLFLRKGQDLPWPRQASSHHEPSSYSASLPNPNFDNFSRKNCHPYRTKGWVPWEKLGFPSHCTNRPLYFWINDQVCRIFHSEVSTYTQVFFSPNNLSHNLELNSDFHTWILEPTCSHTFQKVFAICLNSELQ